MIFDPPIMALLLAASLSMVVIAAGALFAIRVLRHWDHSSGHARQIVMEKQTHLVSTALRVVLVMQMLALILFVHNADRMAVLFTGAMCALGTINVNDYGMPAFLLQVAVFFGAGAWLVVNMADSAGRDYPYTRLKYALLLLLAPLAIAAGVLEWLYFLSLDPNVITSCCSQLFAPEGAGVQADLSAIDPKIALYALFGSLAPLLALGLWATRSGDRGAASVFGLAGVAFFPLAVAAIISVVSPYIYEAPTHHCPFCIMKPQYGFIGYVLYLPLFSASAMSLGLAILSLWPLPESMKNTLPLIIRRLGGLSTILFAAFGVAVIYAIMTSHLILLS